MSDAQPQAPDRVRSPQAVWVTHELEPLVQLLRSTLALQDPFRDPGAAGVRVVWQLDLPDISGTHLSTCETR